MILLNFFSIIFILNSFSLSQFWHLLPYRTSGPPTTISLHDLRGDNVS